MRLDIITCLPKLLEGPFSDSILKRAQDKKLVEIMVHDLRQYSTNKHKSVDDYAFGGGAGMVMMIEPIDNCLRALKAKRSYDEVIYLSPDGELLNQGLANELSLKGNLILLCGHYKGVDERVREHLITREISIGDYVLSGGELAAAVLARQHHSANTRRSLGRDISLIRFISGWAPGSPVYTRPASYKGLEVPPVLLSGHEANIEKWRYETAVSRTKKRRPGLLDDDLAS